MAYMIEDTKSEWKSKTLISNANGYIIECTLGYLLSYMIIVLIVMIGLVIVRINLVIIWFRLYFDMSYFDYIWIGLINYNYKFVFDFRMIGRIIVII